MCARTSLNLGYRLAVWWKTVNTSSPETSSEQICKVTGFCRGARAHKWCLEVSLSCMNDISAPLSRVKSRGLCSGCARDFVESVRNSALNTSYREGTWLLRQFYLFWSSRGFRLGTFSCTWEKDSHQGGQRVNYSIFLLGDTDHGSLNIPLKGLLLEAPQDLCRPNVFWPLWALVSQVWGRLALFASWIWASLERQQETAVAGPCSAVVILNWRAAAWGSR